MAASSVAIASARLRPRPFEFLKRVIDIVPGFLLLAAVGYSGKLVERAIATYGKVHHLTLPNKNTFCGRSFLDWPYRIFSAWPRCFAPAWQLTNSG